MSRFQTVGELQAVSSRCSIEIQTSRDGTYIALEGCGSAWKRDKPEWFRVVFSGRAQAVRVAKMILDHVARTEGVVRVRKRKVRVDA